MTIAPTNSPSRSIGTASCVRPPASLAGGLGTGVRKHVNCVNDPLRLVEVVHIRAGNCLRLAAFAKKFMKGLRQVQVRHGMEFFADEAMHDRELRLADVHGVLEHRVEHGLKFAGRTADHFKNVGGGGLLLQRLRSSLSSRAFSMAMTACAAKFLTSSICLSLKASTSCR